MNTQDLISYIELIGDNIDWKETVINIAYISPDLVHKTLMNKAKGNVGYSEVMYLARSNQKVPAIKKLRELTGMGLKEAKDWVDDYVKNIK